MSGPAMPIDADGNFCGYASLFGKPDQGGDVVMPGAFIKSLTRKGHDGIRMLFQHDPKEPVGVWTEIIEDQYGLWVEGRLVPGANRASDLNRLIAAGAVDGLSIGFRTVRATKDAPSGHRKLWQIDLWEISIVTFPMLEAARIGASEKRTEQAFARAVAALRA